jgi:hypothetical protein
VQLLVLGEQLLSLGKDGQLLVWKIGEHDQPQVRDPCVARSLQVTGIFRLSLCERL